MAQTSLQNTRQIKFQITLDDTKTIGSALETGTTGEDLFNNIISAIKDVKGSSNWYDQATVGLNSLATQKFANKTSAFYSFTVSSGPVGGILVPSSLISGTIAVGPSSASEGGVIAAEEANFTIAGTLGVGLTVAADSAGIVLNRVTIIDAATNEAPVDGSDRTIVGIVQTIPGTSDNATIAGATSENLQISFVAFDPATDDFVAATLPDANYQLTDLVLNQSLKDVSRGFGLGGGGSTTLANLEPKKPLRVIQITGAVAADDALTISTGTFAVAGAQTVVTTFGSTVLPASGALFKEDSRIRVLRNGQELVLGSGVGDKQDAYWVSSTQIAFVDALESGERIKIVTPEAV